VTTATQAYAVLRGILEAGMTVPLRWQNEDADSTGNVGLPDTPAAFIYTEFNTDPAEIVSFGGGRFSNRYRNRAHLDIYVFVPRGWGLTYAADYAEQAAALFRSYRDNDISCFGASVYPGGDGSQLQPPGMQSEVTNYYYAAASVELLFDQIG
jgi:hypothetical protein